MNSQPNCRASAAPSSFDTSRSKALSALFPTSMIIGSPLFARLTDWRKTSSRSKVDRDAIEYTSINPWPSLGNASRLLGGSGDRGKGTYRTHWSRSVAYSSDRDVAFNNWLHKSGWATYPGRQYQSPPRNTCGYRPQTACGRRLLSLDRKSRRNN